MSANYILHIAKWYPNSDDDLEGIFVKRHIESTLPYFKAIVIYAKAGKSLSHKKLFHIDKTISENRICYYPKRITGIHFLDKFFKAIFYFITIQKCLEEILKSYKKPVLIHSHVLLRSGIMAYLYSKRLKLKYIITEHSTLYTNPGNFTKWNFKHYIRRFIVKRASELITVSYDLEKGMKLVQLNNPNFTRIFNCVETEVYNICKPGREDRKVFHILHVSEFKDNHKNITGILDTLSLLKESEINFIFHLVGYGQDLDIILHRIVEQKLENNVLYMGKLFDKDLAELYNYSDVFVLFSYKENMPCVLAEALCCGLPVISSRVGGISEIINETNGILVESGNQQELLKAFKQMATNIHKYDRVKISEDAIKLFSTKAIGQAHFDVYKKHSDLIL
jgi:glycosyltransferase involved in cell wall biosynthesis